MNAIYVRQSIDKKDSISIETQIQFCKKEIPENEETKIYTDKGFSGKDTNRPDFSSLIKDIEQGKIKRVVVYKLDRISRSISDFADIIENFQNHNVDFISTSEKFDTSTPMGRAMLYIIMVFAQLERETISERIRDNYYSRGKLGVWLGGVPPFGFERIKVTLNGKKATSIQPNEDMELVKRIFEEYAYTGKSLGGIAKPLYMETGNMWNNIKLSRLIQNPAYVKANADVYNFYKSKKTVIIDEIEKFDGTKGCTIYGKYDRGTNKFSNLDRLILSVGLHDGIIDSKTWLICQNKIAQNKQIKNSGKGKTTWLTGLTKCGYCGYSVIISKYKDMHYLRCSGRYSHNKCNPDYKQHHLSKVEKIAEAEVCHFLDKHANKVLEFRSAAPESEVNAYKIELIQCEEQINNLISALGESSKNTTRYVNERIEKLDSHRTELLEKINKAVIEIPALSLPSSEDFMSFDLEHKKEITHKIINRILISNDKIEIEWKV